MVIINYYKVAYIWDSEIEEFHVIWLFWRVAQTAKKV